MYTDSFDELELLRYWELSVGIGLGKQAWPELLFTLGSKHDSVVATARNLGRRANPSTRSHLGALGEIRSQIKFRPREYFQGTPL